MKKLFLFFALISSSTIFGALAPLTQSAREMQALLADRDLYEHLKSGEVIQAVIRTEMGYVVMTKQSLLRADIEYLASVQPGPRQFRFHIYPPVEPPSALKERGS